MLYTENSIQSLSLLISDSCEGRLDCNNCEKLTECSYRKTALKLLNAGYDLHIYDNDYVSKLQRAHFIVASELQNLRAVYDSEIAYRKELQKRTKLELLNRIIQLAHRDCWVDGTVLVTPVETLDKLILEIAGEAEDSSDVH